MNDKYNFAGYIVHLDNQYFCTINDYVVKMLYKENPQECDLKNDDDNEKYLLGFDEGNNLFAVLAAKIEKNPFAYPVAYHFSTPILIRGKGAVSDLSYFNGIEFYGETVNKAFNPRQAVERSNIDGKVDNIDLKFKSHFEFCKEFDIVINEQRAKIQYLVYRYVHLAEQKNEDGSISLGSLNSAVRIKFEQQQPLESLRHYWLSFNNFLVFLAGRQNVDFGVKLLQQNGSDSFPHIADCFFRKRSSDIYDGKAHKTIQLDMLGDKFPELVMLFVSEKNSPFLRFLPENNDMANRISDADVLNICTAFEIEFGLDESKDKNKIVQDMDISEFGTSMLAASASLIQH